MEIKDHFKKSMQYIYPNGVDNPAQWRDLIRVYMMGWFDVLVANDLKDVAATYLEQYEKVSGKGWWPDDSWKWW
jgi:hypothetical protein